MTADLPYIEKSPNRFCWFIVFIGTVDVAFLTLAVWWWVT